MDISRRELQRFLEGHARAGEVIARERLQRLNALTEEEARREYEGLCEVWQSSRPTASMMTLDESRTTFLRVRRQRLNLLGRGRAEA